MAPRGVLCAGNLVYDILAHPVDDVRWDATVWVDALEQGMGGNGANTSYAIATLGAPVRLCGWVGSDAYGNHVVERLRSAGVDAGALRRAAEPTATTIVLVRSDGSRAFIHQPGCSRDAFPEPLDFTPGLLEGMARFHLANIFALPRLRVHARASLQRARQAGLITSLDTGWDSRNEWARVLDPCLPLLDYLFVNRDEAAALSGKSDPVEAAAIFRERGAATVVVKLGARGCYMDSPAGACSVPGFAVDAVDTTGAGDCFAGGFIAGLCHGLDPGSAARLANAAGALSVRRVGATAGLLGYRETLLWMESAALNPAC